MTERQYNYEQTLLKSQLEIQEETLRNISQEIRDNIGQVLSLAKLQLNTLPVEPSSENMEAFMATKELVSKAITDLRSLSKCLHPDRVNELGLEENIRQELTMLEKSKQYTTRLRVTGSPYKILVQTQTILFRMVQEALINIIKHAEANHITIIMDYKPDLFSLQILDNGKGIHLSAMNLLETGFGIRNMKNRCAIIGASFIVQPVEGGGTEVCISLPIIANPRN